MAYGLLKRAGAFLLASAMVFGTVSPSLAESLGSDAGGTEDATEAAQADTGSEAGTEAEDETTPPAGSYIICLPEDAGAQYSYDGGHRSEENSDDAFTILLYEEGEEVSIEVESELGFALYGADGSLFLKPEDGELDFSMPDKDLQLVFDDPQAETSAKPGTDENADYWNGGPEGIQIPVGVQVPEAGYAQDPAGERVPEAQDPGVEMPETEAPEPTLSLKWEASNVAIEARMADGSSFPEGTALGVDTPDTLMEDAEGVETYGKAVADALSTLQPDAQFLALYPFEVTLGEAGELPEGQKEFSVTFSDGEIVQALQAGVKPSVAAYAMDHEAISVSGMEMVPAEDMDAYLTDDGKLSVDFLVKEGSFAIAFMEEAEGIEDPEDRTETATKPESVDTAAEVTETEASVTPETETGEPDTFGFANLRFTEDGYTLLKDRAGDMDSHTILGLAADNIGTVPAASAEISFRFILPEGMSAAKMQLVDGKVVNMDGDACVGLWKSDESVPAAITAVTPGNGMFDVTVAAGSGDGLYDPFSGWELMLYGNAVQRDASVEGTETGNPDKAGDEPSAEDARMQVSAHAVFKAPQTVEGVPQEITLDAISGILIQEAGDADPGATLSGTQPIPDISTASIPFIGNGFFMGCAAGSVTGSVSNIPASKSENSYYMFPESFWVYEKDGSVSKYDTKIYFWGDYANIALEDKTIVINNLNGGGSLYTEWHFYNHGTNTEASVGGMLYFQDLDPDEGLRVAQGFIGAYKISGDLQWETRNGGEFIVGTDMCEGQISFKSEPGAPFQLVYNVKTTGWVLYIKDQAPYQLHYHIQGAPAGQKFPVSDGKSVYVMRGINMKEAEDELFPQLSAPGYEFDGWYSDSGYRNKYVPTTSMQANVDVYARFTKIPEGNVNVTKTLDMKGWDISAVSEANRKFTFTLKGTSDAKAEVNQQKAVTGAGTALFGNIPVGTYTLAETCNADAWESQMAGSVTVEGGKTAEVACKNTLKTGEVQVTKALDTKGLDVGPVSDADKTFTFTLAGTSTAGIPVNKQVTVKGAGTAKFEKIPVGTYNVTETCAGLWKAEAAKQVTVSNGQMATVTFTNTLNTGSVDVTKTLDLKGWELTAVPDAAKKFTFTLSGTSTAGIAVSKQAAITGAGKVSFADIPAGTYTITEACNTDVWSVQMDGSVTVAAGQAAAVACKNTLKTGEIQVTKALETKGLDASSVQDKNKTFLFTLSGTSTAGVAVSKQMTAIGAGSVSFEDVPVGTYTVTETCDTGLWEPEGAKQAIVTEGKLTSVPFRNTLNTGSVTVTKSLDIKGMSESYIPEGNKTFVFTLSGMSDIGTEVTRQKEIVGAGTVSFEDIPVGTYTVTESCDTRLWAVESARQAEVKKDQVTSVSFKNTLSTGSVEVTKSLDTKGVDAGSIPDKNKAFMFTLSGMSDLGTSVSQQKEVVGAGSASFEDIPVGTYTVTEECDTGLWKAEGAKQVTVADGQATGVSFTNILNTGNVTVTKTLDTKGVDAGSIPEGNKKFTFTLSGTSDAGTAVNQQKEVTGAGKVSFSDIPVGNYTVTEGCNAEIWDTRMEGSVTVTAGKDAAVACTNTLKTGSVQVTKALDMKGRDVATVPETDKTFTFTLSGTSVAGTAVNKKVTVVGTGAASFEDVPVGSYTVAEACDTQLWIPEAAKDVRVDFGQAVQAAFKNTIRIGDVCISVMDSETLIELDGAEVTISDADGHLAGTVTSSHDGSVFVKGLEIGKEYTVRVVKPRKGYSSGILTVEGYQSPYRDTGYTVDGGHYAYSELTLGGIEGSQARFTLTQGGIQTINIFNKAVRADLRIQAQGEVPAVQIEDGKVTNIAWEMKGIPGAEYHIYAAGAVHHPDGYSEDVLADGALAGTVKTDEAGCAALKDLMPGDYRIVETKTPAGYLPGEGQDAGIMASYEAQLWDKADYAAETFTYDAVSVHDRQSVDLGSDLEPENEDADDPRDPDKGLYKKTGVFRYAVDGEEETPVEGARFTLYANKDIVDVYGNVAIPEGTEVETVLTGADGRAAFASDLPVGEYAARGADHMEGYYSTDAEAIFDTARYAADSAVKYVRMGGEIRDFITVARLFLKDDITGTELAGATLVVSDAEGTPFTTIATEDTAGAGHVIKGLDPGREYVIEETVPREGYTNTILIPEGMLQKVDRTSVSFTLEDHITPSAQDVPEDVALELDNAYVTGSFSISKDGEELISVETVSKKKTFLEKAFDWAASAFTYESKEQEGAEFTVYAAEDIIHPDGKTGLLYHKGDVVGTLVRTGAQPAVASTDADGSARFECLYLGHYTVRETGVPEGFAKNPAEADVTLAYADYETQEVGAAEGTVEYHNIRQKVLVSVTKRDRDDREVTLEGAVFGAYAQEDIAGMGGSTVIPAGTLVETAQSGADGVARFRSELPLGRYCVKEILPPKGYASSDEVISIDATYQPDGRDHLEFSFDYYDDAAGADVYKLAEGTKEPVEGARLMVLDGDGEPVDAWVTDGLAHRVTGLMPGHAYILREEEPAPGYATAADMEFIAADRWADGTLTPQEVTMYDPPVRVRVSAMEHSQNGAESPLDGVELRVTDMEGNEAAVNGRALHWVSQGEASGCYEGLPAGSYTVSAVKVPAGYVMPEPAVIEVRDTGDLQEFTIPVTTTMAEIYATDKETGERVEGVTADLLGEDGEAAYSDAKLEWKQERVPAGVYSVHVKAVPDGYVIPEKDTEITVRETSETQAFGLELGITHIAIKAADKDTGEGVNGAEMRLKAEDGKAVAKWTSDGGWEKIDRVTPGNYSIVTASVPAGYKMPDKEQIEVKNTEDLQEFTVTLEKLPQQAVPKTGDSLNVGLLAAMAALACMLLGLGTALIINKKKKKAD